MTHQHSLSHCFTRRQRSARRLAGLLLLVLMVPCYMMYSQAHAADVSGKIAGYASLHPSVMASATASDKHLYTVREADPLVPPEMRTISAKADRDFVLAIYGQGEHSFGVGTTIRIAGGRAVPATVVIPAGVSLTIRNDDPFTHRLEGGGVSRDMKPGEVHKFEPKGKGVLTFHDPMMPGFMAYVVIDDGVIANRFASHDGKFKLDMNPGEYSIKVFYEGKPKVTAPLKVAGTASVDLKELAVAPVGSKG